MPTPRPSGSRARARPSQADGVRDASARDAAAPDPSALPRGVPTLLVASGRGGAGTSLLSALLAVAAAGDGTRVLLIDADDFVGPLAVTLGVAPHASWTDLRGGRVSPLEVLTPVSATLTLIAGGPALRTPDGAPAMPPMAVAERKACMRRLFPLAESAELVVIDCGSRLDAVLATIAPHADERLLAVSAGSDPIGLASTYALCKAVHERQGHLPMDVVVNRHEGADATRCFDAIDAGAREFLGLSLELAGAIPADPTLDAALRAGMPFSEAAAGSPAANAAHAIVMRTLDDRSTSRSGV